MSNPNVELYSALATLYDYCTAVDNNKPSATSQEWKDAWEQAGKILVHTYDPTYSGCGKCGRDPEDHLPAVPYYRADLSDDICGKCGLLAEDPAARHEVTY